MRFGLLGCVHAEDERLRVALDVMTRDLGVDRVLCSGNVVDGVGDVERTRALLVERNVLVVRGQHDRWLRDDDRRDAADAHRMTSLSPATIAFVKALRPTARLPIGLGDARGDLLLCHGVGESDARSVDAGDGRDAISSNDELLNVLFDPTIFVMIAGRTKRPMLRRFERGAGRQALVVVNAGTLRRDREPGFAVLDLDARRVDFFRIGAPLDVTHASRAVL